MLGAGLDWHGGVVCHGNSCLCYNGYLFGESQVKDKKVCGGTATIHIEVLDVRPFAE
jgi:hypothetical protein